MLFKKTVYAATEIFRLFLFILHLITHVWFDFVYKFFNSRRVNLKSY